jgi:beta-galactosidase
MEHIQWNAKCYQINGKPDFLISGEFHYFRVPKKDWEYRLKLFREAGGNCVATYIPWILHESVEGDIRFSDIPERDLEGFLRLCNDLGIYVICRPGPYQYSEMKYCGLPGWLCENYPQIQARDIHGKVMIKDSISYLHPLFLEKVRKWFDAVCPLIACHTVGKGGPVAFVQFDNELIGIHEWFGGWDYNPETMGFGKEDGRYARFLKSRYDDMHTLNTAYETQFAGFMDVRPSAASLQSLGDRRRVKDYQDFYFQTVAEYAYLLAGWMREAGIDCDFIHNSANSHSNSYYLEMVEKLGERFILGSDLYYNLNMDWDQNNPTPKYAVNSIFAHETLRLMGFPPTVYELPGGSCSDWPPITAEDLKCCYMTNLAYGMKGFNYYIFTGGYNPEKIGGNGYIYDYGAAIGADNTIRPHYYMQKEFGAFLKEHSWLTEAEHVSDFYLGLDWEYSRSKYYAAGLKEFGSADAWTFLKKGFVITSLCASYSPEFLDLYNDTFLQRIDKPMIVVTSECMAAAVQERLVRFVKNGGRLLLSPVIPGLDENFKSCTILKEFLDNASVVGSMESIREVNVGPVENIFADEGLWVSGKQPDGAVAIAQEVYTGRTAAWKKTYPNGAMVIWLGVRWKHSRNEQLDMMKQLFGELQCETPVVQCDNPNIWAVLRSNGSRNMLFIMNLFSSPMKAGIKVKKEDGSYMDTGIHSLHPMEVKTLSW